MRKLAILMAAILTLNLTAPAASVYAASEEVVTIAENSNEDAGEEESVVASTEMVEKSSEESLETIVSEEVTSEMTTTEVAEEETTTEETADIAVETTEGITEEATEEVAEIETTEPKVKERTTLANMSEVNSASANDPSASGNEPLTETPESDFTWDGTVITGYVGSDANVVIPKKATMIGQQAFYTNKVVESVTITENVTELGYWAFYGCSNLSEVVIKTTKIGRNGCSDHIFNGCNISSVTFPENITYIPAKLFANAGFVQGAKVTIPASATEIGDSAFNGAGNLSEIIFAGDKVSVIGAHAFRGTGIRGIEIPQKVQVISAHMFTDCKSLEKITLPSNITEVGYWSFYGCSNLSEVVIETTKIGRNGCSNHIFNGCNISSVTFPENITYIPAKLFANAGFVQGAKVTIPASTTEIGDSAFNGAGNLSEIIFAGDKVSVIGAHAFRGTGIRGIEIPQKVQVISAHMFTDCKKLEEITIPSKVKEIGYWAFEGCSSLEKVVLPANVKTFGAYAIPKNEFLKIYAPKNSASYKWAKANGYNVGEIFTITYNLGGGINAPGNPTAYEKGDSLTFNDPTRNGFEFLGWYKDKDFKKAFTYSETMTGNIKLFAKWKVITYTITYEPNGGTLAKKSPTTYKATAAVTLKNPTKTGYTFTGWYTTEELAAESKVTTIKKGSYGDLKLYAGWKVNTYSIKFAPNAKGVTGTHAKIEGVSYNEVVTLDACVYERKGYEFTGWNTKANGKGVAVADGAQISQISAKNNSVVTLYATWQVIPYTIHYELNGGTNHKNNPATYNVTAAVTFKNPTKTGYTFKGWYTDAEFTDGTKVKSIKKGSIGEYSVFAKWQENTYSIKFAANGSGVVGATPEKISNLGYDEAITLNACEYTREGYIFKGWNTKANGKGIAVADKATIRQLSAVNKSVVTLYAMWEAIPYEITYELDGGTNHVKNPETYTIAQEIIFAKPTKTGYTFKGWYTDENFTKKITKIKKGSTGPVKVYAKWQAK